MRLRRRKRASQDAEQKQPEIGEATATLLTPHAEAQVRDRLSQINFRTGYSPEDCKAFLHEVYTPIVEHVVASITPGSPLRRHAARNRAQALLNKKIKELAEKQHHPSSMDTPAAVPDKPKVAARREAQNEPDR